MNTRQLLAIAAFASITPLAAAQTWDFTVTPAASLSGNFSGNATFGGTFIGNYNQTTNPGGTRTLNFSIFGTRAPAPTNLTRTISGNGNAAGPITGLPAGAYRLAVNLPANSIELSALSTNLIGTAAHPTFPINTSVTYQSFLTAAPNNSYPFVVPIPLPLGNAEVTEINVLQNAPVSGTLVPAGANQYTFTLVVPSTLTTDIIFQGSPSQNVQTQDVTVTGTINTAAATASLGVTVSDNQSSTTPVPLEPDIPFDLPPLSGTGEPAHLLMSLSINTQQTSLSGNATLPATGVPVCAADWDGSGGVDGDDVIAFFGDWDVSEADYNGDGGTDGDDVIAFFADWDAGC
jgi:hypothetical protein